MPRQTTLPLQSRFIKTMATLDHEGAFPDQVQLQNAYKNHISNPTHNYHPYFELICMDNNNRNLEIVKAVDLDISEVRLK